MSRGGKRLAALGLLLSMLTLLPGCSPVGRYRSIERLLVIQTMGLDRKNGSVQMSLCSAAGKEGAKRLEAVAPSVSAALERIYEYSYEEELFCAHVDTVLIGEESAEEGIEEFLDYFCQSREIRIDLPLFIIRGGTANQVVMEVGEGDKDVSKIMSGIRQRLKRRGIDRPFTSADVLRSMKRNGSALICALSRAESSESLSDQSEERGQSAVAFGYAIIRGDRLCGFIEPEHTLAVGLLTNNPGIAELEVRDRHGQPAVLQAEHGGSELKPVWASPGVLEGLELKLNVQASVLEVEGRSELTNAEYTDQLTAQLEKAVSQQVSAVLQRAQSLRSDFLGLGEQVERAAPEQFQAMSLSFADALPSLKLSVTVSGELSHTNDMKEE